MRPAFPLAAVLLSQFSAGCAAPKHGGAPQPRVMAKRDILEQGGRCKCFLCVDPQGRTWDCSDPQACVLLPER